MVDELSELSPIQFIEGINENEQPIEPIEGKFWQPEKRKVAIPYKPTRSYALSRIEIFGSPWELDKPQEHPVRLYTNNNNLPSETCVSEGKLVVPAKVEADDWLQIHLKPVVVFRGQQYWVALEDYSLKFAIGRAKSGTEVAKTAKLHDVQRWVSIDTKIRYMLRFFGRVLPVVQ